MFLPDIDAHADGWHVGSFVSLDVLRHHLEERVIEWC
jgi:hypothetical protein